MARVGLTQKLERFCQLFIELGNGTDAYGQAYDTAATRKSQAEAASKLLAREDIKARIAELRALGAEKTGVTIEAISVQLDEDRRFARTEGNAAAAVSATIAKGKLHGHFVEKRDITIGMRPDQARQAIAALAGKLLSGSGE
jgi:phage terminase small subunit